MTAQQIDYWKLQESKRANQAVEAENIRYHKRSEELQQQVNSETARHNQAIEYINAMNADANAKQAAAASLNAQTNARLAELTKLRDQETARHNSVLEQIDSDYKTAVIEYQNRGISSKEEIASEDRGSREDLTHYTTNMGLITAGGSLLGTLGSSLLRSSFANSRKSGFGGSTTRSVPYGTGSSSFSQNNTVLEQIRAEEAARKSSSSILSNTTGSAVSTAATGVGLWSALPAPILVGAALGLGIGYIADKSGWTYPATNIDSSELMKGVQWYGTE